jgi:CRP/FNR family transcriptional regulator, cyclic AMP receptor protein
MLLTVERVLFLKRVDFFARIDDDALISLANAMHERNCKANETIFKVGDMGRDLFIIVRGRVRLHKGEETIATLDGAGVFGELAALDPETRTASATCLDETVLLRLDHAALMEELSANNDLARGIIRFLVRRFRERG